jgi:hypothetical protein
LKLPGLSQNLSGLLLLLLKAASAAVGFAALSM